MNYEPAPTLFELFGEPKMLDNTMERAVKQAAFDALCEGENSDYDWDDRELSAIDRQTIQAELEQGMRIAFECAGLAANTPQEKRDVWIQALGMLCETAQDFGLAGTVHSVVLDFSSLDANTQAELIQKAAAELNQSPDSEEVQDFVRGQPYCLILDTVGQIEDPHTRDGLASALFRASTVFLRRHALEAPEGDTAVLPNECRTENVGSPKPSGICGPDGQPIRQ